MIPWTRKLPHHPNKMRSDSIAIRSFSWSICSSLQIIDNLTRKRSNLRIKRLFRSTILKTSTKNSSSQRKTRILISIVRFSEARSSTRKTSLRCVRIVLLRLSERSQICNPNTSLCWTTKAWAFPNLKKPKLFWSRSICRLWQTIRCFLGSKNQIRSNSKPSIRIPPQLLRTFSNKSLPRRLHSLNLRRFLISNKSTSTMKIRL